jgi:hypothetical protein
MNEPIDWTDFDGTSEQTCRCRCGTVFRSHARVRYDAGIRPIARKPCPGCGKSDDLWAISSDPELFTIEGTLP